jgi:hypothetical protein
LICKYENGLASDPQTGYDAYSGIAHNPYRLSSLSGQDAARFCLGADTICSPSSQDAGGASCLTRKDSQEGTVFAPDPKKSDRPAALK